MATITGRHVGRLVSLIIAVLIALLIALVAPAAAPAGTFPTAVEKPTSEEIETASAKRVAALIAQLGAEQYVTRERAQMELRELGLLAFDALYEAQYHDDIEIASRARYLVRSMQVSWTQDQDPLVVRQVLGGYGQKGDDERQALMDKLASLPDHLGSDALCRLVRYEPSHLLSKHAALLVMGADNANDDQRRRLGQTIERNIGASKRTACRWLRTYISTLHDPESSLAAWEELTQEEELTLAQFPDQSSRQIARDLLRWQAELLQRQGHPQASLASIRRTIFLIDDSREQLLDLVDWLMHRQMWDLVAEVNDRFTDSFSKSPMLLYRLAESQSRAGQQESAGETARRALESLPGAEPDTHLAVAYALQHDGLFRWAEFEYRYLIELPNRKLSDSARPRILLSEMLHELDQQLAAAEVLKPLVEAAQQDVDVRKDTEEELGRSLGGLAARMHFFMSRHFLLLEQRDQVRDQLLAGFRSDAHDADVLIAMFRFPGDESWQAQTRQHIENAVDHYRNEIRTLIQKSAEQRNPFGSTVESELASACNQLAWLVSNTEGNFDEALKCSLRSVDLRPDAASYLDTLGRCYYAKGEYEKAVSYQTSALDLEPHSPLMKKQLALFQDALKREQSTLMP